VKKKNKFFEVTMNDQETAAGNPNLTQPDARQNVEQNGGQFTDQNTVHTIEQQNAQQTEDAVAKIDALEEVELLKKELEQSRVETREYLDGWQRSRAEFANYKKRVDRDQAQIHQVVAGNIIKRYLEILDDLDRALKHKPQDDEGASWAAGIELIFHKFLSILEAEGIEVMETEGKYFDPNLHEAISQGDVAGYESGQIVEVIHKGYMIGERVLRPALVRVAK
jgi:molecular chaperone GrpE